MPPRNVVRRFGRREALALAATTAVWESVQGYSHGGQIRSAHDLIGLVYDAVLTYGDEPRVMVSLDGPIRAGGTPEHVMAVWAAVGRPPATFIDVAFIARLLDTYTGRYP
jgi:hypothetical protein